MLFLMSVVTAAALGVHVAANVFVVADADVISVLLLLLLMLLLLSWSVFC